MRYLTGYLKKVFLYLSYLVSLYLVTTITGCSYIPAHSNKVSVPSAVLDGDGWITDISYYDKMVSYGTTRIDMCEYFSVIQDETVVDISCALNLTRLNTGNESGRNSIQYGRAWVKIPYLKTVGGKKGMSLTKLTHNIGWEEFISRLSSDDLLIFIHGFNTNFTNAAIRCAQLAHDINFQGEAVFYSWPSAQNPATYAVDKKRANENIELFTNFLQDIASSTDKDIHIVAHSMGTYILMNSIAALAKRIKKDDSILYARREKSGGKLFGQVIFASPDIAKNDFQNNFITHKFSQLADKFTLYSSGNDHVLDISQFANVFIEGTSQERLGESSDSFFVIEGMDTIDARQEIAPQFFGHSFYAEYRSLVSDMHILLNYGTHPDKRMLQKVIDKNGKILWFFRD